MKNRLYAIREWRGLTQKELSGRSGVSLATIYGIERGSASPSLHTVILLSNALRVPAVAIFTQLGRINQNSEV